MNKLGIDSVDLLGKRVLMRVDFNVPMKKGAVRDMTRITSTLPSIQHCLYQGAKSVVLMSHLGRPDGRKTAETLQPVAKALESVLKRPVKFLPDCVGSAVEKACADPSDGTVFLLENLRFHAEEEGSGKDAKGKKFKPSKEAIDKFRKSLSRLGDVYVNDAFGTAHRAHSSVVGCKLPVRAAGFLMKRELDYFSRALTKPARPFVAVLGGAKVSDKVKLIKHMLSLVDELVIGGGMANTFKAQMGVAMGSSLVEKGGFAEVEKALELAASKNVKIHLPIDYVTGQSLKATEVGAADDESGIPDKWMTLDVGPKTTEQFRQVVLRAKTILFNGPVGVFENDNFAEGTKRLLEAVTEATKKGALSIIGGGDSVAAVNKYKMGKSVSHVSTGGGASLELLEGRVLPGVAALSNE